MPDDEIQLGAALARQCGSAVAAFLRAERPDERLRALTAIQAALPAAIRVRDHDGLHVYCDVRVPVPKMLAHAAVYIEARYPDGRAEVTKGGFGPTKLKTSMEPAPKSAIDRLLDDDDLI